MDNNDKLFQGRGRIEYLGDPDDEPVGLIGNPPEMTVSQRNPRVRVYDNSNTLVDEFNYLPSVRELPRDKWIMIVIDWTQR